MYLINTRMTNVIKGFYAGLFISLGGSVYLACENKYIGALLFSIALLTICYRGDNLYTGQICYIYEKTFRDRWRVILYSLIGNILATLIFGLVAGFANPVLVSNAISLCDAKTSQTIIETLLRSFMCGVLIFIAVSIFKDEKTPIGILFAVPVFILSGWEHSVANMFYFVAARYDLLKTIVYIFIVLIGNTLGGILIPSMKKLEKRKVVMK